MAQSQGQLPNSEGAGTSPRVQDDEFDLIDYIEVVVRRRWLVFWIIVICVGLAGLSVFQTNPLHFRAEVNLLAVEAPPVAGGQQSTINTAILKGFGMGLFVLEARIPALKTGPGIDSITVHQRLGAQLTVRQAIKVLNEKTDITHVDVGLVSIAVTDKDSVYAAGIANAYVDALKHYFLRERARRAEDELKYIDSRLFEVEGKLRSAEDSFLTFRAENLGHLDTERFLELQRELSWRQRRVTSWENVYNSLLARQEAIRIEAQRRDPKFEVLSYASVVSERTGIGTRVVLGLVSGLVLSIFAAFSADFFIRLKADGRLRTALNS
jgi:uncharacterized protein involved in exopolysaccharide biosynthesis